MNERKRLVELLSKIDYIVDDGKHPVKEIIEVIADYLLENGVVVLPCKLRLPDEMYRYMFDDNDTKVVVKCKVVKITGYGFTLRHPDGREWDYKYGRIGETVFLTKEEAEQAIESLKGGNENE